METLTSIAVGSSYVLCNIIVFYGFFMGLHHDTSVMLASFLKLHFCQATCQNYGGIVAN